MTPQPQGLSRQPAVAGGEPAFPSFFPLATPDLGPGELDEVADTLRSGWLTGGPKARRFEAALAHYVGTEHAVGLNSCTAGLHLALLVAGIGPGDEVITTPFTFSATANVIVHVGATPIFADIDPATLNIDPAEVARRITPRTKAIMPVHYAGQPCDMDELDDLARRHRLLAIEDAAHAVGARYKGQPIGSARERVAVFSFYAIKNLTTGEGGMLVTGRQDLAERARALSNHGLTRDSWNRYAAEGSWRYDVVAPGFNFHMTDIQAALGLHQLQRLEGFLEHRERLARAYDGLLQEHPALTIPEVRPDRRHARHLYPVLLRQEWLRVGRDAVIEALRRENIGTSVHFQPVHLFSYYRERFGFQPGDFPQAERAGATEISLPLHTRMSEEDAQGVAEALLHVLDHSAQEVPHARGTSQVPHHRPGAPGGCHRRVRHQPQRGRRTRPPDGHRRR